MTATAAPPQNLDAERAVLGAMIVSVPQVAAVIDGEKLEANDFYLDRHRTIFGCLCDLYGKSGPTDELSVIEALKGRGDLEKAGERHYVSELAASVAVVGNAAHYARIVQGHSRERQRHEIGHGLLNGLPPAEAIEGLTKQLGAASDSGSVISRALFDDPQKTGDAAGPAREEVPGSGGLCHREQAALFFSDRGAGKTTAALVVALSVAAAGGKAYYFDRENGAALTMARVEAILDANGWPDVLADGRFVGRHYPRLDKTWDPEDFGEAVASQGFTLVFFDSLREAISQLGGDPNLDADISRFIDLAVTPLVRRRISVGVLDNTGHEAKDRPKGAGSKLDAIPQAYKVTTTERFSPVEVGRIELTCTRSRAGDMDRRWTMRVGGEVFEVPEARDEPPDVKRARDVREKREEFRRACIAALRETSPLGREPLIREARGRGAKGRSERLRNWLSELAADPTSGIASTDEGYVLTPDPDLVGQGGVNPPEAPLTPTPPPLKGRVGGLGPDPGPEEGQS